MSPTSIFASASTPADAIAELSHFVMAVAGGIFLIVGGLLGVSLVIATGSFPGTPAITAATAYELFQTVVVALVALGWGRLSSATGGVAQRARA